MTEVGDRTSKRAEVVAGAEVRERPPKPAITTGGVPAPLEAV